MTDTMTLEKTTYDNTYFCTDCGTVFTDTYDCAVDMECLNCGARNLSPFSTVDEGETPAGELTVTTACAETPDDEYILSRLQANIGGNQIFIYANKHLIRKMSPAEAHICLDAGNDLPNCLKEIHHTDVEKVAASIKKILQPITEGENDLVTSRMQRLLSLPQTDTKITLTNLDDIANDRPLSAKPMHGYTTPSAVISEELLKSYNDTTTFFKTDKHTRDNKAGKIALFAQLITLFTETRLQINNPFNGALSEAGFELLIHIASQTPNTEYEKGRTSAAEYILRLYDTFWPSDSQPFRYRDNNRDSLLKNLSSGLVSAAQVSPYLLSKTVWRVSTADTDTGHQTITFHFDKPDITNKQASISTHPLRSLIS